MIMMSQDTFWNECRGQAVESVKEAFHSLPPRYYLAAALLLPVAVLASACRLALGWAADRFSPQKA